MTNESYAAEMLTRNLLLHRKRVPLAHAGFVR